jgi:single-strand DNA-binding protein
MQERVTLVGNLTADPELRHTHPACRSPTCACRHPTDPRRRPVEGRETTFHTVTVWRDQAEHAAETLAKGARVIVVGRPK